MRRVARKYLDPSHLAIVVVGDRKSIEGPLAKLAPVEIRDLDGEPVTAGAADTARRTARPTPGHE